MKTTPAGLSAQVVADIMKNPFVGVNLSTAQWEDLIFVLRETRLLSTLCELARGCGVFNDYPEYARKHLAAMSRYAGRQKSQVLQECANVNTVLSAVNITPVFLKGAAYTLRATQNSAGRLYSDIDVLVPRASLDAAQAALAQNHWASKPMRSYDEKYYREWAHEIPPLKHKFRGAVLDLHHNLVPPISGRAPDISHFLNAVEYTEQGCAVLSASATVLHSIIHLVFNEEWDNAFRDLLDISMLIDELAHANFWEELHQLAHVSGFKKELGEGLYLLNAVFGVCPPPGTAAADLRESADGWASRHILLPAALPHHPLIVGRKNRLAISACYLRGHWLKMPLFVLLKHLVTKAGMSLIEMLLGRHFFEKSSGNDLTPGKL